MKKRKLEKLLKKTEKKLIKVATQATAPTKEPVKKKTLTVSKWLLTFRQIVDQRGYHAQTLKNRNASMNHIERLWGDKPLKTLKPFEISTGIKTLSTANGGRVLSELRDVFSEAIANGEAEANPASHVKPPSHNVLRSRLTLDTWKKMVLIAEDFPQKWVKAMLYLAMATGQRRGDLAKMKFDDVVDGCLRIEQQKKARKKIGARVSIPLDFKIEAVGMSLGEIIEMCKTIGKPGPNLLRQANGSSIEDSSLSARFHEIIVKAEGQDAYPQYGWPSLHEVRSLAARTCIEEGMTPERVQVLLGHKHVEMTLIYANDRGLTEGEWKQVEIG